MIVRLTKFFVLGFIKDKYLLMSAIITILILCLAFLSGSLAFSVPRQASEDIFFTLMGGTSYLLAILLGGRTLVKDEQDSSMFLYIDTGQKRLPYLCSKVFSLFLLCICHCLIVFGGFLLFRYLVSYPTTLSSVVFLWGIFIETFILVLISTLFSTFLRTPLVVLASSALFITGRVYQDVFIYVENRNSSLAEVLRWYPRIFPDFSFLNLKNSWDTVFNQSDYLWRATSYGLFYSLGLFCLLLVTFRKRDIS